MDFEVSDDQRALRDAGRRLIAAVAPIARTRELAESAAGYDLSFWRAGADLGWPALALAESAGGLGQGLIDLVLVAIDHARSLVPSPLLPTDIVVDALATSPHPAAHAALVAELVAANRTAAWACAEPGDNWPLRLPRTAATRSPGGYCLTGSKRLVQDARCADVLLVEAVLDGDRARFLVDRQAVGTSVHRVAALDITRELDDIAFAGVELAPDALVAAGPAAAAGLGRSLNRMAVLVCADLVGVGERLLELTVDYAGMRVQFDRPIGSFQAIKHKCATMRIWLQAATAATYYAAMALDAATEDAEWAVSAAKAYCSVAIVELAGEALQVHGGIGFTWEHDLHLYLRRAKSDALLYGDAPFHRELLCRMLEDSVLLTSVSS